MLGPRPKGRLDGSQGSPPVHQVSSAKPPLEPKWAVTFSLITILGGIVAVAVAHALLFVPLTTALLRYAIVAYITVGFSWASLERRTHNAAIRANNAFVIFTVCLLGVLIVVQDEHEAFPEWATALLVVAGIAGYSVMGIHGVRNFRRWRRGQCLKCGYSLMGNTSGVCPECGTKA